MRYSSGPGRWLLTAAVLGSGMAAIDSTVVGIALPSIGRELHTGLGSLQWVVSGYLLSLAALLLLGGALGDQLGRRKVFQVGVAWFTISSVACALATGPAMLIGMRLAQGAGAALLTPGSLALIQVNFVPADRSRAIGAWSGLGGVATAAGPLLGGYLLATASWRWIFLINVPLGVLVLWISGRHVPESKDRRGSIDLPGALLAVVALLGVTYGLIEGPSVGYADPVVLAMFTISAAAAVGFVVVEARSSSPMVPLGVVGRRQFVVTNVVTFVVYAALGGTLFLLPVELQVTDGYTPFESGISLLPLTAVMLALSARSGRLSERIGPRLQMTVGPIMVGGGLLLLQRATHQRSYVAGVLPAVVVFALGLAVTVAPLTATAMGSLPDEHAGLASAINNDVARLGGLIAVASLPAMAGLSGAEYLNASAVAHSFRVAMVLTACWSVAGGVIAGLGIRNPSAAPSPAPAMTHCALDATPMAGPDRAPPS